MEIVDLEPEHRPGSDVIARFNVRMPLGIKLMHLKLHRKPDGSYRIRSPKICGNSVFHLAAELVSEITSAAVAATQGWRPPHARYI